MELEEEKFSLLPYPRDSFEGIRHTLWPHSLGWTRFV